MIVLIDGDELVEPRTVVFPSIPPAFNGTFSFTYAME